MFQSVVAFFSQEIALACCDSVAERANSSSYAIAATLSLCGCTS
jgi:hypothetical protein